MPDPYNLSAGRMIGTPYYSPRTSSALRRLAGNEDYEVVGASDDAYDADMAEWVRKNALARPITESGKARGTVAINGKIYVMGPGGSASEINNLSGENDSDVVRQYADKIAPAYAWEKQRKRTLNADEIARSPEYRKWKETKSYAEQKRIEREDRAALSAEKVAEARAMRQIDRDFEDPNAAAMRAMQMRLMEAQLKPVEREASSFRTQRERELDAQDKARANRQAQAMADQIQALEATRNPQKMATAAALRAQFAKQFAGSDVALPGATGTAQEATAFQLSQAAPMIDAVVDSYAKPLFEREAQAEYQRSGWLGGAFTRNTADRLTPEEVQAIQQNFAAEARKLEAATGVPAQTIYSEMLRKASTKLGFSAYEGTAVARPRVDELMSLLRGPWNDGAMR